MIKGCLAKDTRWENDIANYYSFVHTEARSSGQLIQQGAVYTAG